ncbi:hydroxyacid dehydrogenase [Allopusillimonas ginsengisoli]|uniref:hydroxyacid dehydrogenase n=1 Tax=Allopusillimonas ginsengisoli TaxID=453575 RepID=UPI001484FD8A
MKVVISEFMDEASVASLSEQFNTVYDPGLVDRRDDLRALLSDARALIVRNRTQVDADILAAAPALEVVGRLGVGLDNIDSESCQVRGIAVIPAVGANALAVAEYVIGTAMVLLRGAYTRSAETAAGQWPRADLSGGREMAGKTLGLIGFGGIGQLTAGLAQALGVSVMAYDPMLAADSPIWGQTKVRPASLDEVLTRADIVSLHVPLTDQTRKLIDRNTLQRMKPGAILINTARGGIVDESALADALRAGSLSGAAVDVFDNEPLPKESPLADLPNTILTPHIAGVTLESNIRVSALIAQRVAEHLQGKIK